MIKEAYVSYEIAKLLKEKGFDWDCTSHFDSNHIECPNTPMNFNSTKYWVSRPTHQMACAWLREVHNKHMQIAYDTYGWHYDIIDLKEVSVYDGYTDVKCWYDAGGFDTYEEAVESALKYTLENLI